MENHRPWSDLPHPLLDQILDRLPLPHYIRFSAVCPRWRSVQIDHCRRGRLVCYPWLIPDEDDQEDAVIVPCYSPFERCIYRLRNLPISSPFYFCRASSPLGWRLLRQLNYPEDADPSDIGIIGRTRNGRKKILKQIQMRRNWPPPLPDDILSFYFLNPILNICISLPPIRLTSRYVDYIAISLVVIRRRLFLFRACHRYWITLPLLRGLSIREVKSCAEKFYCICSYSYSSIVVVNPCRHHAPLIEHFEMDVSQLQTAPGWPLLDALSEGDCLKIKRNAWRLI